LVSGDLVTRVSGHKITDWEDMLFQVQRSNGAPMLFEVERNGRRRDFEIIAAQHQFTDKQGKPSSIWLIGIEASNRMVERGFWEAGADALKETWNKIVLIGVVFSNLFTGKESLKDSVGGPVMIGQIIHSQATSGGLQAVLKLAAMLSINLGLLNLLPIPALDGGHVLFNLIETIFRRPVPLKIQSALTYAGFSLLIALMVLATLFDLFRLSGLQD
jgi:regulator of sigma E protease